MTKTETIVPYVATKIMLEPDVTEEIATPKARTKLLKLDAIRGFAALYVVCNHTLPKATIIAGREFYFFRYSQEAVILFFILSGFVIQYAYATTTDHSFKSFFLKRFLRIYIPLFFVFLADFIIHTITDHNYPASDLPTLIGNLLMLQNVSEIWLHPVMVKPFLGNSPLWTLAFEWWFYMLFFFITKQFVKRASAFVYFTGIVAALTYLVYPFFVNRELMYLVIWWVGADIANLYINGQDISIKSMRRPLLALLALNIILLINIGIFKFSHPAEALILGSSPVVEIRHFGFALGAIIIAIYWRKFNWVGFKYTFGLFQPLASISFALYISHWFLVSNAKYLDAYIGDIYFRSLVYFLICCLFCYVVERIIYPATSKRILHFFSVKKKPFVAVTQ